MSKIVIVYGTKRATIKSVAEEIKKELKEDADIYDIKDFDMDQLKNYDVLLLGTSTIGHGDIQQTWKDKLFELGNIDLSGKKIALFGLGNQVYHKDTFCGGMSHLYAAVKDKSLIAEGVSTKGYKFEASPSVIGDKFVGLALDQDNESGKTPERIKNWLQHLGL